MPTRTLTRQSTGDSLSVGDSVSHHIDGRLVPRRLDAPRSSGGAVGSGPDMYSSHSVPLPHRHPQASRIHRISGLACTDFAQMRPWSAVSQVKLAGSRFLWLTGTSLSVAAWVTHRSYAPPGVLALTSNKNVFGFNMVLVKFDINGPPPFICQYLVSHTTISASLTASQFGRDERCQLYIPIGIPVPVQVRSGHRRANFRGFSREGRDVFS